MKNLVRAVAIVVGLVAPGLAIAAPAASAARPACDIRPSGQVLTLEATDTGKTVCIRAGQRVDVVLAVDPTQAPSNQQWWQSINLSGSGLTELPTTLMPMRGTTLARFQGSGHGTALLSSTRRPCAPPPSGGVACELIELWSVTVVVR